MTTESKYPLLSLNKQKYRPVFSTSALLHIQTLAKRDYIVNQSDKALEVLTTIAPYIAKIEVGAITPAYTEVTKPSLLESLGAVDFNADDTKKQIKLAKEEYWKACYEKLISNPEECTVKEIQAANEYKYLNDLMTEDEIKKFESEL